MMRLSHDDIASFIEEQLAVWKLAKMNYDALIGTERRNVKIDDLWVGIQHNPARIVSTGAKIDRDSIAARRCFLCADNRPAEQMSIEIAEGWEMLVNPYPILPVHLTIASKEHRPQDRVPMDIVAIAESLPGMAVFFNGACAGASAPDHMHLQAVLKDELPLVRLAEDIHRSDESGIMWSSESDLQLPFLFMSGIVAHDTMGMTVLAAGLNAGGPDKEGRLSDSKSVNTYFWISDNGQLRFLSVPRKAHRPRCYSYNDSRQRLVSPGCIDMAGLLILPREKDYRELTAAEISTIFSDVALPSKTEFYERG